MRSYLTLVAGLVIGLFSSTAFAEIPDVSEWKDVVFEDAAVLLDSPLSGITRDYDYGRARGRDGRDGRYRRGERRDDRYSTNYRVKPEHMPAYRPTVQNVQPTVVVVQQPQQVEPDVVYVEPASPRKFSFGVRATGLIDSNPAMPTGVSAGGGIYFRIRPHRFFGVEIAADMLYGTAKGLDAYRYPITAGMTLHIFDYGMLDVYGIAGVGFIVNQVDEGYSFDYEFDRNTFIQAMGQFGGGFKFQLNAFEIMLDARYTLMQVPDYRKKVGRIYTDVQKGGVDHGLLFTFGLGFAI